MEVNSTETAYKTITKYARLMSGVRLTEDTAKIIVFKKAGRIYVTAPDADFDNLAEDEILPINAEAYGAGANGAKTKSAGVAEPEESEMSENAADFSEEGDPFGDIGLGIACEVLAESKTYNAMIICKPVYTGICVDAGREIPAVLDDMAQIIGPTVKRVALNKKAIVKSLINESAVMIENGGDSELSGMVITAGRNLYETYTGVLVLEKSAEIILKSSVIGGAKTLSWFNRDRQHSIYIKSYSKTEKEYEDAAE